MGIRNKFKFLSFIRKKTNTNPKRGPFHHRSPAMVFKRCVRGMLPKKKKRGYCALARLKTFVGCPAPYDKKKKVIVPDALRILCLRHTAHTRTSERFAPNSAGSMAVSSRVSKTSARRLLRRTTRNVWLTTKKLQRNRLTAANCKQSTRSSRNSAIRSTHIPFE